MNPLHEAKAAGFRIGHGRDCVFLWPEKQGVMSGEEAVRLGTALIQQGYAAIECESMEAALTEARKKGPTE